MRLSILSIQLVLAIQTVSLAQDKLYFTLKPGVQIIETDYSSEEIKDNLLVFSGGSPYLSLQVSYFLLKKLYIRTGYQQNFYFFQSPIEYEPEKAPGFLFEIPFSVHKQTLLLRTIMANIMWDFSLGTSIGLRKWNLSEFSPSKNHYSTISLNVLTGPELLFDRGNRLGFQVGFGYGLPKTVYSREGYEIKISEFHLNFGVYYSQPLSGLLSTKAINNIVSNFRSTKYKLLFFNGSKIYR